MTIKTIYLTQTKRLLLAGVAVCALAVSPFDYGSFDFSAAFAQSSDSGNAGSSTGSDNAGGNSSAGGGRATR